MGKSRVLFVFAVSACMVAIGAFLSPVHAEVSSSSSYKLDGSVGNSLGDQAGSANYQLVNSGGESIVGNGSSGSYKLGQGYTSRFDRSLQLTLQQSGLMNYYPFDEPSGSRAASYTINGTPIDGSSFTWTTGKVGGAIGSSQAGIAQQTTATQASSAFTFEVWINPQNITDGNTQPVFSTLDATGGYKLSIDGITATNCAVNDLCFTLTIGGTPRSVAIAKTSAFPGLNGTWVHIAGTYDGASMRLFVNGAQVASAAYSGAVSNSSLSTPFCLGGAVNGSTCSYNSGSQLDELKFFNSALTPEQIQAEYQAQNTGIASGLTFGSLTPGSSSIVPFRTIVATDASGYSLAINQNQNLTSGANTIPGVSGSIASPVTWNEGNTKGLGFSLYATNASALPGSWSGGNAYAALPSSQTTFYNRTGTPSGFDYIDGRLRIDINGSQTQGAYSNQMTITGTITP